MRSRQIRLAWWIAALTAAVGALLILSALDIMAPLGIRATVQVAGPPPQVSSQTTVRAITDVAERHEVNIVKLVEDLHEPGTSRHLYAAVGNRQGASAAWLRSGYPAFATTIRTEVGPLSAIGDMDPRGVYYLYDGPADAATDMQQALAAQGYEVAVKTDYALSFMQWMVNEPFGIGLVIALLLCVMLVGSYAVMSAKGYAIQRLHGAGAATVIGRDLAANAAATLAGWSVIVVACGVVLYAYNHGAHWVAFAQLAIALFMVTAGCMAVAYLIGFAIALGSPMLTAIKGRLPQRLPSIAVYCIRIPATLLTVWSMAFACSALIGMQHQQQAQAAWQTAGDAVTMRLNPNLSVDEQDSYSRMTGEWLQTAESDGQMILAHEDELRFMAPPDAATPNAQVLLVNDNYLHQQTVVDDQGQRWTSAPSETVLVMVPSTMDDAAEQSATQAIRQWVASQATMYGNPVPAVSCVRGGTNQQLFGYGSNIPDSPTLFSDAMLVVVNADTGMLSASDYTAYASQGDVLLPDAQYALDGARNAGVADFVLAVSQASQQAADDYAALRSDLVVHAFNVVTAAAILIISAVAIAQIRVRERAQTIFARYVHGWSFARTHLGLLTVESVLALAPIIWAVYQVFSQIVNQSTAMPYAMRSPLLADGWLPLLAVALALANLATCLIGTARYTHNLVRNHAREE